MLQVITHTLFKVFSLVACTVIALGCQPVQEPPLTKKVYEFPEVPAQLTMPHAPLPVERELTLRIELPSHVTPGLSTIAGESMYMGSIPLQWKQNDTGSWEGTLYLGACTEPRMLWRMTIPLLDESKTPVRSLSFTFTSVAN